MWVSACLSVWRLLDVGGHPQHNTTPPGGQREARAIRNSDFSEARITTRKNNSTAHNGEERRKHPAAGPALSAVPRVLERVSERPAPDWSGTALLFPLQAFIKRNGLLNRVLCRADLFMFLFPLSFLKAVINIINI